MMTTDNSEIQEPFADSPAVHSVKQHKITGHQKKIAKKGEPQEGDGIVRDGSVMSRQSDVVPNIRKVKEQKAEQKYNGEIDRKGTAAPKKAPPADLLILVLVFLFVFLLFFFLFKSLVKSVKLLVQNKSPIRFAFVFFRRLNETEILYGRERCCIGSPWLLSGEIRPAPFAAIRIIRKDKLTFGTFHRYGDGDSRTHARGSQEMRQEISIPCRPREIGREKRLPGLRFPSAVFFFPNRPSEIVGARPQTLHPG